MKMEIEKNKKDKKK